MESDQAKLFIGGISWETTEDKLQSYFSKFGEVVEAVVMKDRATGRARGFGFVVFTDPAVADRVVLEKHSIDGRMVEAKKAVPRDERQSTNRLSNGSTGNPAAKTKKIFVGGLASSVTENDFRKYFAQFGTITDVVVMYDHGTQRPRGFGFITYDSEEAVDKVLQRTFHELNEKMVEVKRAIPKELSTSPIRSNGGNLGSSSGSRGSPYTGSHAHAFNSSPLMSYSSQVDVRYGSFPSSRRFTSSYGPIINANPRIHDGLLSESYSSGVYLGGAPYGGADYFSSLHRSSPNAGFENSASAFGDPYNGSLGRNPWVNGGASYDIINSSGGFEADRAPSLSSHGGPRIWDSSQLQSNNSAFYGNHAYSSHESNEESFIVSESIDYGTKVIGVGSSLGALGVGRSPAVNGTFLKDIYSSSGFNDSTWRTTPADKFRSPNAGFGGFGSGFYGFSRSVDTANEDERGVNGGYGVTEQLYRGFQE